MERMYDLFRSSHCVTTDSRCITPGCIFFAFKGERFDGNAYVPQALEQGAALCVTTDGRYAGDPRCAVVDDVLDTLQQLARRYRADITIPVLGITGTNGKTTTKELVHAVLARRYRTACTKGNFNNHLGVPLTILSIPVDSEIAIVEMGANHPGEIEALCKIADPDCGLITNVGRAHLEGFGSFEGVVNTKTELYRHLAAKGGQVFVNADNEILCERVNALMPESAMVFSYGTSQNAFVRGTYVGSDPYLHFYFEHGDNVYNVRTHLLGAYNFDNAMAAVAVGLRFGVEPFDIKEAIEAYVPANQRSQWKQTERNNLYLDCYNANPSSMAAAIDSFRAIAAPHKAAVIGAMRELGTASSDEHRRLVELLEGCGLERVVLVGHEFDELPLASNMAHVATTDEARALLENEPIAGATVLVKGSNGNRLWELEEVL